MRGAEASLQALIESSVQPPGFMPDNLPHSSYTTLLSASGHETQTTQATDISLTLLQTSISNNNTMGYGHQPPQGLELRGMGSGITHSQAKNVDGMTSGFGQTTTSFSCPHAGNVDGMTSVSTMHGHTTTSFPHLQTGHVDGMTSVASGHLPGITSFSHPSIASHSTGTLPGIGYFSSLQSANFHTTTTPSHHTPYASIHDMGKVPAVNKPRRNVPNVINMNSPYAISTPCRDPNRDELEKARHRQLKAALRKERNKEAARRSNLNKKLERDRLEKKSLELWEENLQLNQDIQDLKQKLHHFRHMRSVMQHVCHPSGAMMACH
ncbi:uncharacterized protein [Littorina saxatilis]|uniref:BZIP domain-containing protein n=1 Tax=Littorina saxatilis TaxID=31220 RepID=A0AAN9GMN0_9CAEN